MKYQFRVWEKSTKQMDYNFSLQYMYEMMPHLFTFLNQFLGNEDYVFMRALGHKDRNGKDMWEGDIVKTWANTGEPCFGGQTTVLRHHNFFTNPAYVEVVGNEWENPELIQLR